MNKCSLSLCSLVTIRNIMHLYDGYLLTLLTNDSCCRMSSRHVRRQFNKKFAFLKTGRTIAHVQYYLFIPSGCYLQFMARGDVGKVILNNASKSSQVRGQEAVS